MVPPDRPPTLEHVFARFADAPQKDAAGLHPFTPRSLHAPRDLGADAVQQPEIIAQHECAIFALPGLQAGLAHARAISSPCESAPVFATSNKG